MNNLDNFTSDVACQLEVDKKELITSFQLQNNQNWDSLGLVAIIGLIEKHFQCFPDYADVNHCQTFGDLVELTQKTKHQ